MEENLVKSFENKRPLDLIDVWCLVDTVLFYEKEDCVQTMTLIKKALSVNYEFDSWDVREVEESLLEDLGEKKPEWVDALRPLLLSSY